MHQYKDEILNACVRRNAVIISAPPGAGKSTIVPMMLYESGMFDGMIIVCQPRRIAAACVAARVAALMGVSLGEEVGYRVRFENRSSSKTRILFCTYGVFLSMTAKDPFLNGVSAVLCDEFHERSLENDTALAWMRFLLQNSRTNLKCLVLSATLDIDETASYLKTDAVVDVSERAFPVKTVHVPIKTGEPIAVAVKNAMSFLLRQGVEGSVLVFCAGKTEINTCMDELGSLCAKNSMRLCALHGSLGLKDQLEVMNNAVAGNCVILATNVAETSVTVPGVRAVIDTGFARIAAFDTLRERNTLYVSRISMANAAQRAGRAGRTGPGICIKLWSKESEESMPAFLRPETQRLDISRLVLMLNAMRQSADNSCTGDALKWLTPPPQERIIHAVNTLVCAGACFSKSGETMCKEDDVFRLNLTDRGMAMARLPLHPQLASVLLSCTDSRVLDISLVMAALLENNERTGSSGMDLFELALEYLSNPGSRNFSADISGIVRQFRQLVCSPASSELEMAFGRASVQNIPVQTLPENGYDIRKTVSACWAKAYNHRIASALPDGMVYTFTDSKTARLVVPVHVKETPRVLVALQVYETGGQGSRLNSSISFYLPVDPEWLAEWFPGMCSRKNEVLWDNDNQKVLCSEKLCFGNIVLYYKPAGPNVKASDEVSALLTQKVTEGGWKWQGQDSVVEQLVVRIRLASRLVPEMDFPSMDHNDWQVIYSELCEGRHSIAQLSTSALSAVIRDYIGPSRLAYLDRVAPVGVLLPSGRKAKIRYYESEPPELSARITDFTGCRPDFTVFEGRQKVVFDILAPNYRTVQKTNDLAGFWKKTYPELKTSLSRRYPKHPWP